MRFLIHNISNFAVTLALKLLFSLLQCETLEKLVAEFKLVLNTFFFFLNMTPLHKATKETKGLIIDQKRSNGTLSTLYNCWSWMLLEIHI